MTSTSPTDAPGSPLRRRLLMAVPLGVMTAAGGAFYVLLQRMEQGSFSPHDIGNPMLGQPMPDFALPGASTAGFAAGELRAAAATRPVLLNFFASWCVPCIQEAEALGTLAADGVAIWGIAYKDKPDAVQRFLGQYGNPYARLAMDSGRTAIDFGLSGVPETFLIGRDGRIAWHIGGPLTAGVIRDELRPRLARA